MAIQPIQPQSIGGVLDTTFQLYKDSLGAVWPLCLLLAARRRSAEYLFDDERYCGLLRTPDAALQMLSAMSDPVYWVINLVTMAATLWVMGALYLKQQAIGTDQELSNGSALQAAVGRILPLFLMSLLFGLALIVGAMLLLIPFFILVVSLMLATALLMFEGKGPVDVARRQSQAGVGQLVAHGRDSDHRRHPGDRHLHGGGDGDRPRHAVRRRGLDRRRDVYAGDHNVDQRGRERPGRCRSSRRC